MIDRGAEAGDGFETVSEEASSIEERWSAGIRGD
jgi:hypothetical protein